MDDGFAIETLVELALAEDVGSGDRTTEWTVPPEAQGRAVIVAKEPLVVAGGEVASLVFRRVEPRLQVTLEAGDGEAVGPEDQILQVLGPLQGILTAERVALNFLGRLSGIASQTRRYVEAVRGTHARILDTRKTTPGWRALEKEAVRAGGGENHRFGLYDMVLVKDNHLVAGGGVAATVHRVEARNQLGLGVEVEVNTLMELEELLSFQVDRILLDNMDLDTLEKAVARVRSLGKGRPGLEASGNVTLDTVRGIAETGVDFISVGALTHSAPQADLSLRVLERWV
jgi:nicotinate-nucleotide pyrophosphorylase (carboxylating)